MSREPNRDIRVRDECESDHDHVRVIHEAAFGQPAEAHLVDILRRSASPKVSRVAEVDGEQVGHIFLSPVSIEGKKPRVDCAGLAPLGVLPAVQGMGVGSALVRDAITRCPEFGWASVFLLGDPAYYARFGFALAAPRGLRFESPAFDTAFQCLELESGALEGSSGWVRYHEAFADL